MDDIRYCESRAFTWFEKFSTVIRMLPPEQRDRMKVAIVDYGAFDVWPDLDSPYDAVFESMREDIENSAKMRAKSRKGNAKRWGSSDDGPQE